MHRRRFIQILSGTLPALSACSYLRIDPWNVLVRSDFIRTPEQEAEILSRARVERTEDGKITVLYVQGTGYERGYQHGVLLRKEVQENLGYFYEQAVKKFYFEELFAECYERQRPFIPQEYVDEMQGLAHGARMPLHVIHHIHALPEMGEWGGKKRVKAVLKKMMDGYPLGTTCSNLCASGSRTADGKMYTVRILDWGLHKVSHLHRYPAIVVGRPSEGLPYANIGWIGFLGAISGMNAASITLGEMGYRDPENETMSGKPMPFLMRDILSQAKSLADVRRLISTSVGTNSFAYLMSDGKNGDSELYIRDRDRFVVFKPGQDIHDNNESLPGIADMVYGGHYNDKMTDLLGAQHGTLTPEILMKDIIPQLALKSNFQNVIYEPKGLRFWVSNAKSPTERAAEQPYTYFDFGSALQRFPAPAPQPQPLVKPASSKA